MLCTLDELALTNYFFVCAEKSIPGKSVSTAMDFIYKSTTAAAAATCGYS